MSASATKDASENNGWSISGIFKKVAKFAAVHSVAFYVAAAVPVAYIAWVNALPGLEYASESAGIVFNGPP